MKTRRNWVAIFEHIGGHPIMHAQALSFVAEDHDARDCAQDIVDYFDKETGHGKWQLLSIAPVGEWLS